MVKEKNISQIAGLWQEEKKQFVKKSTYGVFVYGKNRILYDLQQRKRMEPQLGRNRRLLQRKRQSNVLQSFFRDVRVSRGGIGVAPQKYFRHARQLRFAAACGNYLRERGEERFLLGQFPFEYRKIPSNQGRKLPQRRPRKGVSL